MRIKGNHILQIPGGVMIIQAEEHESILSRRKNEIR